MTTKIQAFAKQEFDIELSDQQLQYIAIYASTGSKEPVARTAGISTASKVIYAYLQDGLTVCPNN